MARDDCQDASHLTSSTTQTDELQNKFEQPDLNQPRHCWAPPAFLLAIPLLPVSIAWAMGSVHGQEPVATLSHPPSFQDSQSPQPVAHNVPRPRSAPDRLQHLALPFKTSHPESLCKSFREGWGLQAAQRPHTPTSNSCKRGNLAASPGDGKSLTGGSCRQC